VPVFKRNHIPINCHSLHTLNISDAVKQQNVRLLMGFLIGTIWQNRS